MRGERRAGWDRLSTGRRRYHGDPEPPSPRCAGFLFQKVGKLAATAVGGGFLLLQIASHSGYVQIDWKRVEKDVNKAKRQIKKRANKAAPEINNIIEEATEFVKQNIVISSGFVGGFLLGLAS
ncbi:FUN14 domain-containing protein 1-like [Dama dama]|uniref:FUN14 domain-containing protein 1-like n=1 Tax=Dama dama TaxID=30532 RepID=UPI002A3719E1|nr:FUN14 domain-containing protein 1-like [Dama dama]